MRLMLLGLLVLAPTSLCLAANAGQEDAMAQLAVRKPVNNVCPFDGMPVDGRLQPVSMLGSDGQEVLVGTCSQACNDAMHLKFGDDARAIASAAKANTTLAKAAPQARNPATQPAAPYGQLVTPTDPKATPEKSDTKKIAAAKHDDGKIVAGKHDDGKPHTRSSDPDERQREKKAAQRRDGNTKAGNKDSDKVK